MTAHASASSETCVDCSEYEVHALNIVVQRLALSTLAN